MTETANSATRDRNTLISRYLSPDNFAKLEQIMRIEKKKTGEALFWEEEPADRMIYVCSGEAKILKNTEDGKEMILQFLQQGDLFGEFGGASATFNFSAVMMSDGRVGIIPLDELENLIAGGGTFALEFMKWLGLLNRITQSKFRDLMMFGKNGALASTLIRMTNSYGDPQEDGSIRITMKMTNAELAQLVGTTREGVNRALHAYIDDGALAIEDGHMVVKDIAYFRTIVCCPNCPADICRI